MFFLKICPLCNIKKKNLQKLVTSKVYGDKRNKTAFFHCFNCDARYQFPRLSKKEESVFYKKEFEKFMEKRSGKKSSWTKVESHLTLNQETFERRNKYIKPYLKNVKSILEIGCSSGFMLYPMQKKGIKCVGIEPSGVFSKYVKKRGIEVFDDLNQLIKKHPKRKFDLITHFFVLEHISDPIYFFKQQIKLLNKGGKIIFEVPNVADPLHTIYNIKEFEEFYWQLAHHWYFSKKSLNFVLRKLETNYKILHDQRYDLSNHIIWARDRKPGGMKYFSNKLGEGIEIYYKNYLKKIGKCDTLIGVIEIGQ